jgi:predicted nucleic acid-binding protein
MKTVFDSSSFAKRYVAETGSDTVDELCRNTSELGLCVLCVPEIISALNRRRREGHLPQSGYKQAKAQLAADVGDATVLHLTTAVTATAIGLLEENVLHAMDALHVACALEWQADLFVTSDQRQLVAAETAGLDARLV